MQQVEIRIEDHLDKSWVEWLEGFTFSHTEHGETVLTGKVKDQAALYGLIAKLRDLGVKLVSVNSVQQPEKEASESEGITSGSQWTAQGGGEQQKGHIETDGIRGNAWSQECESGNRRYAGQRTQN